MIRAVVLALVLAGPVTADTPDAVARDLAAQPDVPAAIAATWDAAGPSMAVAGFRRIDGDDAVRNGDAWHVGSLGKAMTATLAARLVDRGLMRWDTPVSDWLQAGQDWKDVTLAELLTHRSGMAANLPRWRTILRPDRAGYVAHMLARPPESARGAFLYSNAGYVVAGAMMEAATGQPWEDLMRREVFGPLGMEGAGFGPPANLLGHGPDPVPPGWRADNIAAIGPAGTIHLPGAAILAFLKAHATRPDDYLSAAAWDRLHRPVGDYAMGWTVRGDGVLGHAGSNTLWFARMRLAEDRAAFVAVNSGVSAMAAAVETALDRLLPHPATPEGLRP